MSAIFASPRPGRPRASEFGGLLAIVYVSLIPVVGIITAFHLRTATELRAHEARKAEIRATHRALAAIEVARNEILNSTYTSGNNDKLRAAMNQTQTSAYLRDPSGTGYVAFDVATGRHRILPYPSASPGPTLRFYKRLKMIDFQDDTSGELDDAEDKVTVYSVNLVDLWHMVEAKATSRGVTRTARLLVRERDPFSRFMTFVNSHYQGTSGTPKGDIHTNRTLQIFYPGSVFDDFVSARDGFQWMIGASWGNTTFNGGYATPTPSIAMPALAQIQSLKGFATGTPYYVGTTYKDIQIRFTGNTVQIKGKHNTTGVIATLFSGAFPPQGVIYAEGNISILEGTINGRVTVVTPSTTGMTISNSLRYLDAEGDPAMINPTNPATYGPNPAYGGNSTLGLISNGPVLYSYSVPNDLEVNAALFSRTGNVGLPGLSFTSDGAYCTGYNASFQKNRMAFYGAMLSDRRQVDTVVNGAGTILCGFQDGQYIYDRNLLNTPPPKFLEIDRPLFKGVEILENLVDA